jgi:hypothetical protein
MKVSALKYTILSWASFLTILIIVLMPFHAFLTVWGASLVGHYTALRLWKEVLLVICGIFAVFLLVTDRKIRTHTLSRRLVWLIVAYVFLVISTGLLAWHRGAVTPKAFGYGVISDLRYLIFFLITWAISLRLSRLHSHWQWMTLWPAAIVVIFGILQFLVLPNNFLAHFGYNASTIVPYETINHNQNYIRVASTLRGANPLGAYLIIPVSMLSVLLLKKILQRRQLVLLGATLLCLLFSFSRSAWLGALASLAVVAAVCLTTRKSRQIAATIGVAVLLLGTGSLLVLRHNDHFENLVFHTQEESKIKTTSNEGHAAALKSGFEDIRYNPLGSGTGTAGPASVYNGNCSVRIAENYYLQIGQETGILGLGLFIVINLGVGCLLWIRRSDPLALSLFAALVGLTVVNMLSHAWADDTLAYIWWGLAGIAMTPNLKELRKQHDEKAK